MFDYKSNPILCEVISKPIHTPFIFLWRDGLLFVELELSEVCPFVHEVCHALVFYGVCKGNSTTYEHYTVPLTLTTDSDQVIYFFGGDRETQVCLGHIKNGYND